MGRRVLALAALAAVALLVATAGPARPDPISDSVPQACQPDPTAGAQVQTLTCRYGPMTVTPGTNLILFGPVTVESPRAEGFITRFRPDMVLAGTDDIPPIHEVHLHHGVWINGSRGDPPFFATGEEKTVSKLPEGYGYATHPWDQWVLNYMVHNLTGASYEIEIVYELDWVPATANLTEVEPIWLDVVGGVYPVYNPELQSDGTHERTASFTMPKNYDIVWMAGHVHPGGLRDEVRAESCDDQLIFTSEAQLNERNGAVPARSFGSWDYLMTATPPGWKFTVEQGDKLNVTSVYDTAHPWYEAMGIVFGWGDPLTNEELAAREPCTTQGGSGEVTREIPPDAPVFGNENPDFYRVPAAGQASQEVRIAAFSYLPTKATVQPGQVVRFENFDAAASIFHTVTPCEGDCTGNWGQSYPLPVWGFDSGQLGYGPPGVTAAANQAWFDYTVPAHAAGSTIPYFCRVHPGMRGWLEVTNQ